jgi:hypothetical protein
VQRRTGVTEARVGTKEVAMLFLGLVQASVMGVEYSTLGRRRCGKRGRLMLICRTVVRYVSQPYEKVV